MFITVCTNQYIVIKDHYKYKCEMNNLIAVAPERASRFSLLIHNICEDSADRRGSVLYSAQYWDLYPQYEVIRI